jgi:hypothetical protein
MQSLQTHWLVCALHVLVRYGDHGPGPSRMRVGNLFRSHGMSHAMTTCARPAAQRKSTGLVCRLLPSVRAGAAPCTSLLADGAASVAAGIDTEPVKIMSGDFHCPVRFAGCMR